MYALPTALAVGFLFRTILDPGFQVLHFSSELFVASRQVPGVQHENQPDETIGQEKIRVHHAAPGRSEPYSAEGRCPVSSFEFLSSLRNQFAPQRAYPSAELSQRHPLPDQIREQAEERAPSH